MDCEDHVVLTKSAMLSRAQVVSSAFSESRELCFPSYASYDMTQHQFIPKRRVFAVRFIVKPQTALHMRFEIFRNRKPHHITFKPRYPVRFNAGGLCGLDATESGRTEFDVGLRLRPDRVRHQTLLPNAQTKDRVRHLRQNLSLRNFTTDRVRGKTSDPGPSLTSQERYQTLGLRTESVV
ncbi:hypothetical protein LXL04_018864 [Taraxacum kok-saghyz]